MSAVASAFVRHSNSVASVVGGRPSSVVRVLSQALKVHSDSLAAKITTRRCYAVFHIY